MERINYKLLTTFLAILMATSFASASLVSNSEDWRDVHTSMQLADHQNRSPYFTRTVDASGILNELPRNSDVVITQSNSRSYLPNLENRLETENYVINNTIEFDQHTELIPEDGENFVVVDSVNPSASIPAASLAHSIDGWVVIVTEDNTDEVSQLISDSETVIRLGEFRSSTQSAIEDSTTESIEGGNRFELSTAVLERIEEEREINSILLSDGNFLEEDLITGETPVLLTGTNYLPEESEEYLLNNEDIETSVAVGPELGVVGEEVSTVMEEENRNMSIFIKYGQGRSGESQEVSALSVFQLPNTELDLQILAAEYISGEDEVIATFRNPTSTDLYASSSITFVDENGNGIETVGDQEPQFMPAETTKSITYQVDMDEETAENADAEFTTAFGTEASNLNTYVESQEQGVYQPPRTLPVSVIDIEDNSEVELSEIAYNKQKEAFEIKVRNSGSVQAYTRAEIQNLNIDGLNESLSSEVVSVSTNQTQIISIPASVSEQDLSNNRQVNINLNYGQRESFLIKSKSAATDLLTAANSFTDSTVVRVVLLILALIAAYAVYEMI